MRRAHKLDVAIRVPRCRELDCKDLVKLNRCIDAFADDEREQMDFPEDAGLVGIFSFEFGEVGLGLLARPGLEAALELGRLVRPGRAEMGGHRGLAAFVAALLDLPEQPASGQVRAVPDLFREIVLVRLQKPGPRLPRRIGRSREASVQQFADRLSVQARPTRDRNIMIEIQKVSTWKIRPNNPR